jgi:hypothetical protein
MPGQASPNQAIHPPQVERLEAGELIISDCYSTLFAEYLLIPSHSTTPHSQGSLAARPDIKTLRQRREEGRKRRNGDVERGNGREEKTREEGWRERGLNQAVATEGKTSSPLPSVTD